MKVIKDNIRLDEVRPERLCNNVYLVERNDGYFDLAQAGDMTQVFDGYHDRGIKLKRITHAGGRRNPRIHDNELG